MGSIKLIDGIFLGMNSKTLLLLESDDAVLEVIQTIVLNHDFAMETAFNAQDAQRLLAKGQFFAFAFNANKIPEHPLEYVRKIKIEYPDLPLFAILDDSYKNMVVELLQAGTYACLGLPFRPDDFAYNLSKVIANHTETYNPFALIYEERIIVMPNDFSLVMQVAKSLVSYTLPPNEKHRYHVILGLSEIINNAIEHGNLGISFEEKSNALKASRFYSLAIERAHQEPFQSRVVTIRSKIFPHLRRIEYIITDQGQGFNWHTLPDPTNKENLLNRNGRGIMMARYAFDEIIYNEIGNEVVLVVNLDIPYRGRKV